MKPDFKVGDLVQWVGIGNKLREGKILLINEEFDSQHRTACLVEVTEPGDQAYSRRIIFADRLRPALFEDVEMEDL